MKLIKRVLIIFVIILLVVTGFHVKGGYDRYKSALEEKPLETVIDELKSEENYTKYEDIPKIYFDALVAVEDRRFYKHNGFDFIGSCRAVYNDIKAWELLEGGSTIAQQLSKNLYFPNDHTLERKIAEIFMALEIEREYEKEDVLEFYVNGIYYGSGYYNIYDASMGYFGKAPSEMNNYECTLLVGIPNAPSIYSLKVNPDLAHKRQSKVLECMVELEYISDEESEAIKEKADYSVK